ncbi:MAG: hypothetical protein J0M19_11855 [Sphingomonadales bacterium]|nr:hypothetical protein [Sphingomonadales bacterium]
MNSIALALSLLLAAPQSSTQDVTEGARTGSRLDPATRVTTNADTSQRDGAMLRFIECAVTRREAKVRELIDTRSEAAYQRGLDALSGVQRCSVSGYVSNDASVISFGTERGTLRGFIAEAFVKKGRQQVQALAPLAMQRTYARDWYAMTGRARPIDEMATCVADINPGGILALLKTEIGSKEEKAAVAGLGPSLGQCLAVGYKLNANRLGLRTALAEGLYHRTFDAPPVADGGTR